MTYGSETRPLLVDVGLKFERAEMQMIRWMCGISLKDRKTNEELRRLVGVEPITTLIRSGRLRWYGHVMRKGDEDWVNKCMEYRVEGRRPVGRPRKTWLESVDVDMAELEIDKEDVHDRSKWRRIPTKIKLIQLHNCVHSFYTKHQNNNYILNCPLVVSYDIPE